MRILDSIFCCFKQPVPPVCPSTLLCDDKWSKIFRYLSGQDLARTGKVYTHFYHLTNEPSLWKRLCLSDAFGTTYPHEPPKETYIRRTTGVFQEVAIKPGHNRAVTCLIPFNDGFVSGWTDGTIRMWQLVTPQKKIRLHGQISFLVEIRLFFSLMLRPIIRGVRAKLKCHHLQQY